jgi:hypothetical protein
VRACFKVVGGFVAVWVSTFLLFLWASIGFWPISTMRGWIEAQVDLAHGRYKILGYGLPPRGMPKYISLLHERYGVEYRAVTGCVVEKGTLDYTAAYNGVSEPVINRKFGHDIFKEVERESFELPKKTPAGDFAKRPSQ